MTVGKLTYRYATKIGYQDQGLCEPSRRRIGEQPSSLVYTGHFETRITGGIQLDEWLKLYIVVVSKSGNLVVEVVDRGVVARATENAIALRCGVCETFENS